MFSCWWDEQRRQSSAVIHPAALASA